MTELFILVAWSFAIACIAGLLSRPGFRHSTVASIEGTLGTLPRPRPAGAARTAR